MNCPVDGTQLQMTDRQGIEIDYCPTCRGVWLDRGELDKLVDRSAAVSTRTEPAYREPARESARPFYRDDDDDDDDRRRHGDNDPRRKRRRSFLDDLFDFD